jgi:hypothetical protein
MFKKLFKKSKSANQSTIAKEVKVEKLDKKALNNIAGGLLQALVTNETLK